MVRGIGRNSSLADGYSEEAGGYVVVVVEGEHIEGPKGKEEEGWPDGLLGGYVGE